MWPSGAVPASARRNFKPRKHDTKHTKGRFERDAPVGVWPSGAVPARRPALLDLRLFVAFVVSCFRPFVVPLFVVFMVCLFLLAADDGVQHRRPSRAVPARARGNFKPRNKTRNTRKDEIRERRARARVAVWRRSGATHGRQRRGESRSSVGGSHRALTAMRSSPAERANQTACLARSASFRGFRGFVFSCLSWFLFSWFSWFVFPTNGRRGVQH